MIINFKLLYIFSFIISTLGIVAFFGDFGFNQSKDSRMMFDGYYHFAIAIGLISTAARYYEKRTSVNRKAFIFDLATVIFTVVIFYFHFLSPLYGSLDRFFESRYWVIMAVVFTFIREFSDLKINFKRTILNPAQLFISSFIVIILMGAFLLTLPKATTHGISFLDALFTSTSAVCVTGLSVLNTGSDFTTFGKLIIIILIQIGGLGILTFASYFSYFFKGGTSYENQLALSDMTSSKKLGDVFSTLKNIILITFGIELFSGILIYTSVNSTLFTSEFQHIFFSIFHSVSAFCNAGFSTLDANLYDSAYKYNYYLHLVVIFTFVFGGLGFPIVVNIINYIKYKIAHISPFSEQKRRYRPWVLTLDSRITLVTTVSLTIVGTIIFYILEYHNTLAEHEGFGKFVTALFGATTPRTAGFNTINNASMSFPTIMVIFLLMWVGASPQSTGGGIKTNTFAIAFLNVLSLAKGKSKVEIFRREIADISIRRAFAIMTLSLMAIGLGVMLITFFDPDKNLLDISFECFSAYSTVGLSLGITASLSEASKMVLIGIMFVGRISMLSLAIAIVKKSKYKNYSYPKEEITIN
ncbi:potassium transporter TrkG [Riemerella anatipestifer]|uniref:TrkH family potassium uptake protein n=1 Tax=Riemerella anatipestifer TaxID=34085 RepID=UPI0012AD7A60|nr:potassium transporter TrkG [Riemerella anatipestifer]MDY3343676.1 potassium transporter TrkG [Riemerella anatipestifer]MDY3356757.1 potassium transporter TrkG [Riemerella anatipestifer]USL95376.1 ATPase [Riemerella anatipestifer]